MKAATLTNFRPLQLGEDTQFQNGDGAGGAGGADRVREDCQTSRC